LKQGIDLETGFRNNKPIVETLGDLLNKVEAIFDCGAGKPSELAKALNCHVQRVYEWVKQRKYEPGGLATLVIRNWAVNVTTRIAMAGHKMQSAYRTAYREVCAKRLPGNGRN
jgi:hypothetical protein